MKRPKVSYNAARRVSASMKVRHAQRTTEPRKGWPTCENVPSALLSTNALASGGS